LPEEPEPPKTVSIEQMNATAPSLKDPNQRGDYIVGNLVNAGYDDNVIDAYLASNNIRPVVDENTKEVTGYEFIDPDMEVI
jgi:hypothetical protein